jgi:hypothetical protein
MKPIDYIRNDEEVIKETYYMTETKFQRRLLSFRPFPCRLTHVRHTSMLPVSINSKWRLANRKFMYLRSLTRQVNWYVNGRNYRNCLWNFVCISARSRDICTSGLKVAILKLRSRATWNNVGREPANMGMVENIRIAFGISLLSRVGADIYVLPVCRPPSWFYGDGQHDQCRT